MFLYFRIFKIETHSICSLSCICSANYTFPISFICIIVFYRLLVKIIYSLLSEAYLPVRHALRYALRVNNIVTIINNRRAKSEKCLALPSQKMHITTSSENHISHHKYPGSCIHARNGNYTKQHRCVTYILLQIKQ